MNTSEYISLIEQAKVNELNKIIRALSYDNIIKLRLSLEALGYTRLIRSMYYDYDKQAWIE